MNDGAQAYCVRRTQVHSTEAPGLRFRDRPLWNSRSAHHVERSTVARRPASRV